MRSVLYLLLLVAWAAAGEDYYKLLGVEKDADDRTIRKAFKKLAISKHPDKNPGDEDAHDEFVKINKAYEVLKDAEMRKKYDQFGEEGLSDNFQGGNQYQSWNFYNENFGIYDDDAEIVTLNRADFSRLVSESGELWIINFYSTFCSHCHTLAPTWRKFARAMHGAVQIGAVNCAEDPQLCQSQRVNGYPSIVAYPRSEFYHGHRELEQITEWVAERLNAEIHTLTSDTVDALTSSGEQAARAWLVDFCDDSDRCLTHINRRKLAAMLDGLVNVATVNCFHGKGKDELCETLERTDGVVYYPAGNIDEESGKVLDSLDPKEISDMVIGMLAPLPVITGEQLDTLLEEDNVPSIAHVVWFVRDKKSSDERPELKRLPSKINDAKVMYADCSKLGDRCPELLDANKLPTLVVFKNKGGYEINYAGTPSTPLSELAAFARASLHSPFRVLTRAAYAKAVTSGDMWLVDYFAPWCPPCMRLMGELRRLHSVLEADERDALHIGSIDCTRHQHICTEAGVTSYPTTILHFDGKTHKHVGFHAAEAVVDFIDNALNPSVEELTPETFASLVEGRDDKTTWVVDFFAPWCGPCQQLAPELQKAARAFRELDDSVRFGSLDCQAYGQLCTKLRITAYPNIKLYSTRVVSGKKMTYEYPGHMWRNADSIQRWTFGLLPSLVVNMGNEFFTDVLDSNEPWLVDFFAPWCGHCIQFAPVYEQIAKKLEGRVKLAKVDCDQWPGVCQQAGIRAYPSIRLYKGGSGSRQDVWGIPVHSQLMENIIELVNNQIPMRKDEL